MNSEECAIISEYVKETLDYSEYTVIKSALWFVQTLNLFSNFSLFLQLLVSLHCEAQTTCQRGDLFHSQSFDTLVKNRDRSPLKVFSKATLLHIYVDHSCGVTTV